MTAFDEVAVFLIEMAARPGTTAAEHAVYEELLLAHLTAADPRSEEQLEALIDEPLSWRRGKLSVLPEVWPVSLDEAF